MSKIKTGNISISGNFKHEGFRNKRNALLTYFRSNKIIYPQGGLASPCNLEDNLSDEGEVRNLCCVLSGNSGKLEEKLGFTLS
ncbi:MAG: hypothetical protein K8L99_26370 [Anaerolineae bacterium]|nr:hypothetical protein [Anaerolineae bacterium]